MNDLSRQLVDHVRAHRCYNHPIFEHWVVARPSPRVIGAFFHHMEGLCTASRPGHSFDQGLDNLERTAEKKILRAIVASEEDHGPHLATMAGFLVNRAAGEAVCPDLSDQAAVEGFLKGCSRSFFSPLPGYDLELGRLRQDRRVQQVFARRKQTDHDSTLRNIGTLLAVEMIADGHVFPGELHCLFESGLYGAKRSDPEMQYLFEHAGEGGAEVWHAETAIEAVAGVISSTNAMLIREGADECLAAIAGLWDLLDGALLTPEVPQHAPS